MTKYYTKVNVEFAEGVEKYGMWNIPSPNMLSCIYESIEDAQKAVFDSKYNPEDLALVVRFEEMED